MKVKHYKIEAETSEDFNRALKKLEEVQEAEAIYIWHNAVIYVVNREPATMLECKDCTSTYFLNEEDFKADTASKTLQTIKTYPAP